MIDIALLGPVEITVNGGPAPAELLWRKHLALLVYLACSPRRGRSREHLMGLLWPEKPEAAARHSLTVALSLIRQVVGEGGLGHQPDPVALASGVVRLDTEHFDACAAAQDWRGAAALVVGGFMEGFSLPHTTGFEEWLAAQRRSWSGKAVDALLHLAAAALDHGRTSEAASAAGRAAAIDPLSEPAAMMLMRAFALGGEWTRALQEFERFRARLAKDLGTSPSPACTTLTRRIREEQGRAPRHTAAPPVEPRRAPLAGRGADLERLWQAWRGCVSASRAAVGMVSGDSGVGKSRLAQEVLQRARLDGAATAAVRGVSGDRGTPWSGVLGLATGGLLEAAGLAGAQARALAWFAGHLADWADRFPAAREVEPGTAGQAFSEVLRAAAHEQPLLLLVDDAEQLDVESLRTFTAALRDLADRPLFVLYASAPHAGEPELDALRARLGREVDGVALRLAPLDSADLRELARWALPAYGEVELDRLTRRVASDSAGLPLLAVELLSAVAAGLDLTQLSGGAAWPEPFRTLDQTLPTDLPEAVVSAIRVGFRRLSPAARSLLQAVAVLDGPVPAQRLARATGLEGTALPEALDELEWSRWLVADGRGYAYVARIVRDIVRTDQVTEGQRQRLVAAAGPD